MSEIRRCTLDHWLQGGLGKCSSALPGDVVGDFVVSVDEADLHKILLWSVVFLLSPSLKKHDEEREKYRRQVRSPCGFFAVEFTSSLLHHEDSFGFSPSFFYCCCRLNFVSLLNTRKGIVLAGFA